MENDVFFDGKYCIQSAFPEKKASTMHEPSETGIGEREATRPGACWKGILKSGGNSCYEAPHFVTAGWARSVVCHVKVEPLSSSK